MREERAGIGAGNGQRNGQGWGQCKQMDGSAGEDWGQAGEVTRMGRQWARDGGQ